MFHVIATAQLEAQLERAAERHAVLIVRLKKTVSRLHQVAPEHHVTATWFTCPHAECRLVRQLVGVEE
jgi:hypothetical protein